MTTNQDESKAAQTACLCEAQGSAQNSQGTQGDDPRAAYLAGKRAFKELTAPIRKSMIIAQVLGVLYGALAVAPTSSSFNLARYCWLLPGRASHLIAVRLWTY